MAHILVVDDEPKMRRVLEIALESKEHRVTCVPDGEMAWKVFNQELPDVVISDIKMPGMSGVELLTKIKKVSENTPVIMITAFATVESAVETMKIGAFHYLMKPFNIDEIVITVEKALEYYRLKEENRYLKKELADKFSFDHIIGESDLMNQVYERLNKVIDSNATILISGKSGTGKELIARAIHFNSPRKGAPFVPVDCAAIPENLMESELFGHEKGAFTGAESKKLGKFELAHSGTIFFDEIAEMPPNMQAKLLRVLQEREIQRVGGHTRIKVDVRVIAATNRDIREEVRKGNFREDLYYRLNVVPIYLPELRKRKQDIPLLASYFLKRYCRENNREQKILDPEVMKFFMNYEWPGNVRELENLIHQLVLISRENVIRLSDLPDWMRGEGVVPEISELTLPATGLDLPQLVRNLEIRYMKKALEATGNVQSKAAKLLNISRKMFRYKKKKYGL